MKKYRLILPLLIIALTVSIFAAVLPVGALTDGENIWKITHADGTVSYSSSFSGAFNTIYPGDVFEFLPDEYYLYKANFASVRPTGDITLDLRGATIYCPEIGDLSFNASIGDVNAQLFNLSSNNGANIKVLLEGAEIYAPLGGRTAFSASGDCTLELDGGELGGKIFAPGALNLTTVCADADAWSYIRNVYCYKASQNMHGCVCARNSAKLKLIDSAVIAPPKCNLPLLVRDSGHIELQSSFIATIGGGNVIEFSQLSDGAAFTVGNGSAVYGSFSGLSKAVALDVRPTSYFTYDITSYADNATVTAASVTVTERFTESVGTKTDVPGLDVQEYRYSTNDTEQEFTFAYAVSGDTDTSSVRKSGYPWRISDSKGNSVYAKSLAPLAFENSYTGAELLESITAEHGEMLMINSAFTLDLGGNAISVSDGGFEYLICTRGSGKLSVTLGDGDIRLGESGFIGAYHTGEAEINSHGTVAAGSLVYASDASIAVTGGIYYSYSGRMTVSAAEDITLSGVTFYSWGELPMAVSGANLNVSASNILANPDACAIYAAGGLTLAPSCNISGACSASKLDIADSCCFVTPPTAPGTGAAVINEITETEISVLVADGDFLDIISLTFKFPYKTEAYILTEDKQDNSVWKIELKNGTVKYAKHVYAPFTHVSEYSSLTLLSDISLDTGLSVTLAGDLTIDISGRKITRSSPNADVSYMLFAVGDGKLTVLADNSTVVLGDGALVACNGINACTVNAEGAYVEAGSIASSLGTEIAFKGGFYRALSGSAVVSDSSVNMNGVTVTSSEMGTLVFTEGDLTLNGSTAILAETGACAVSVTGKLYMAKDTRIYGTLKAASISSEVGAYISYLPKNAETNIPIIQQRSSESITQLSYEGGEVTAFEKKYIFLYKLSQLDDGLLVSFGLGSAPDLNIYIPEAVANRELTLRIMLQGVLYDADLSDAESVRLGNTQYKKFTYRYVYPASYSESVMLTLISGKFVRTLDATVGELLSASFAASESDSVRAAIATYANYSMAASGITPPEDWEMAAYVHDYVQPKRDTEFLEKYISYVKYDVLTQKIILARAKDAVGTFTVRYTFGDEELSYEFASDITEMAIPVYRTDAYSAISITYTAEGSEPVSRQTDLFGIAAYAKAGTSAGIYLCSLLAYVETLK